MAYFNRCALIPWIPLSIASPLVSRVYAQKGRSRVIILERLCHLEHLSQFQALQCPCSLFFSIILEMKKNKKKGK